MKQFYFLVLFSVCSVITKSQSTANYTMASTTGATLTTPDYFGNAVDMNVSTFQLLGAGSDAAVSAQGWLDGFLFMGKVHYYFYVNDDGLIKFGTAPGAGVYNLNAATYDNPEFAAFSGNLRVGTNGKVHYKVVGTAPNQTLIIEFRNMQLFHTAVAGAGTSTWQVRYSSNGILEYVYGTMNVSDVTTAAAMRSPSIGFSAGTSANQFLSYNYNTNIKNTTGSFTVNTAIAATGNIASLTGRKLRFSAPGHATHASITSLSAPTNCQQTLNTGNNFKYTWSAPANMSGVLKYMVTTSPDNISFSNKYIYSVTNSGFSGAPPFYFRVYSVSEGAVSAGYATIAFNSVPNISNSSCGASVNMVPNASATSGTTNGGSWYSNIESCTGPSLFSSANAWYKFTATGTNKYTIKVTGSGLFDPCVTLYSNCGGTFVSCENTPGDAGTETLLTGVLPVGTYYYRVYGMRSDSTACSGAFTTSVSSDCYTSGTKTIGATGNYTSISAAIADLANIGIGGPVILELKPDYVVETSISLLKIPCASSTNTITIRPAAGNNTVYNFSTSVGNSVSLNNAKYFIIDGRPGGTGTSQNFSFTNLHMSNPVVQFIDGASHNQFLYCKFFGSSNANTGVICFAAATTGGNGFNTIDHCEISPAPGKQVVYSIASYGASPALPNDSNKVTNCNIHDYFGSALNSSGIFLALSSSGWTISNNKFYQSIMRTATAPVIINGILTNSTKGGHMINGNIIGYNTSVSTGYTNYSGDIQYSAIELKDDADASVPTITGNTIANIWVYSSHANTNEFETGAFSGIRSYKGIVTNNTIGSVTTTQSIIANSTANATVTGIWLANDNTAHSVTNNTIAGMYVTSSQDLHFTGIMTLNNNATITGNSFGSLSVPNSISVGCTGSGNFYIKGIRSYSGTASTSNISSNKFYNFQVNGGSAVSSVIYIFNEGHDQVSLNSNDIKYSSFANNSATFIVNGVYQMNGTANATININSNNISDWSNIPSNMPMTLIVANSTSANINLTQNTINNIVRQAGGTVFATCIYAESTNTNANIVITNNTVSNIDCKTGLVNGMDLYVRKLTVQNNNIFNITGGEIRGIYTHPASGTISNNSIYNITPSMFFGGFHIIGQASNTPVLHSNMVYNVTGTSNNLFAPFYVTGGATFYKNKVYGITNNHTNGLVYGFYLLNYASMDISNNIIGQLFTPNGNDPTNLNVIGMVLYGNGGANYNISHNTVHLTGSGTGTNFRTATIFEDVVPTISKRNNLFINNVSAGTGFACAVWRNGSSMANIGSSSDKNIYYTTPGGRNTIMWDQSTGDTTIAAYRKRFGDAREWNSKTENPSWFPGTGLTGSSSTYLHLNAGVPSFAANAGTGTAAVSTDFDNEARNPSAPDISADEFAGIVKDGDAPVITYSNSTDGCTGTRTITATITDATGIVTTGALRPILYFKKNSGNYVSVSGTLISGTMFNSSWSFVIDPSLVGGLIVGDQVTYYIAAQDLVTSDPNVGSYPAAGFYADNVLKVLKAPSTPVSYPVTAGSIGTGTWLGVNNNWFDTQNWCGGIPTASTDVNLPTGLSFYPIVTTGTALVKNLVVNTGATLVISGDGILQVNGTVSTSNRINASDGTIELAGASVYVGGSNFVTSTIKNLLISNHSYIQSGSANKLKIKGRLYFGNVNSKTFNTNGNLTLLSDATGTASADDMTNNNVNSGNNIVGNVVIERYIPAGRKWRLLSVPAVTSQTIRQSWMENAANVSDNPQPGYGTTVTDNRSNAVSLGFDAVSPGGPSMKYYDAATNTYLPVGSPSDLISNHQGYMNYVRGDRSCLPANTAIAGTVLRLTGSLKQNIISTNIPAGSFDVVGNPYASRIDLRKLTRSNLTNFVYIWDPKLSGSYGLGAFQTLQYNGANFTILPGGGSYGAAGSIVNTIESGQAFFVKATVGAGTIQFNETAKNIGSDNVFFTGDEAGKVRILLSIADGSGQTLTDGVEAQYHQDYTNELNDEDGLKLFNTGENISFKRNDKQVVIEQRSRILVNDTLHINLTGLRVRNYILNLDLINMDQPGMKGFLVDQYLQTTKQLALNGTDSILFNVTTDAGSYASDRFMIIFQAAAVVPVKFVSVIADRRPFGKAVVEWNVADEINIEKYHIERSADGITFSIAGSVAANTNNGSGAHYTYDDSNVPSSVLYYRIKSEERTGEMKYSAIVKIAALNSTEGIFIYPNPVSSKKLKFQVKGIKNGQYSIIILDNKGQKVQAGSMCIGNDEYVQFNLHPTLAAGKYIVQLRSEEGKMMRKDFILVD